MIDDYFLVLLFSIVEIPTERVCGRMGGRTGGRGSGLESRQTLLYMLLPLNLLEQCSTYDIGSGRVIIFI